MTPEEHYAEAERWLAESEREGYPYSYSVISVQRAQVHATLATITTPPLGRTP